MGLLHAYPSLDSLNSHVYVPDFASDSSLGPRASFQIQIDSDLISILSRVMNSFNSGVCRGFFLKSSTVSQRYVLSIGEIFSVQLQLRKTELCRVQEHKFACAVARQRQFISSFPHPGALMFYLSIYLFCL